MKFNRHARHGRRHDLGRGANGARTGTDVWDLLRGLLAAEVDRLWRRLLRRPEPPTPFAEYRARRGNGSNGDPPPET